MVAIFANIVWIIFQLLIGFNLVFPFLLYLIFLVKKKKSIHKNNSSAEADYAIIVTAYEQTETLPPVIDSLLKLNYSNYLIYIVADKCDVSNLQFDDEKVIVLRPEKTLASNTRSHFYAIRRFKRSHDRLTIIDSDNLVEPDYLNALNTYFDAGFAAVQGERKAKNLNTTVACVDAARDIYYHYFDGQILFAVGSSATLAGSGMAFTVELYRNCLEQLDITGAGFDKVLQKEILSRKYRIAFTKDAVVYDEKTSRSDQLINQRARWINTWFRYFRFGFVLIAEGIFNFNWNQFLFGFVLLRPPLFIFLILSFLLMMINVFIDPFTALIWLTGFIIFTTGFFIALLNSDTDKRIYQSLGGIPKFIFYQVLSLLKVRKANKHSVATQHFYDKKLEEIKK
ncbi:MAG: glycosyltransferase family 2 protein [Bacteroidota bacterium]|nr:glycosyltransferase family 2 protein [Bacteroidota bacterium]